MSDGNLEIVANFLMEQFQREELKWDTKNYIRNG